MASTTMDFEGKNKNLDGLSKQIVNHLNSEGYQVQSTGSKGSIVIQAKKDGVLRDIIAANRAFTIMVKGEPNDFTVEIGIGKFVQNLAVTAVESLVLSELFLAVDVPEMLWTKVVEKGIAKDITDIVNGKKPEPQSTVKDVKATAKAVSSNKKGSKNQ